MELIPTRRKNYRKLANEATTTIIRQLVSNCTELSEEKLPTAEVAALEIFQIISKITKHPQGSRCVLPQVSHVSFHFFARLSEPKDFLQYHYIKYASKRR
jgi:hypothetical protein